MKLVFTYFGAAILLIFATAKLDAEIIAGPFTNAANGHEYYLLSPNTWPAAEAEAENMGGTLAIIKNTNEQKWIISTFGSFGEQKRDLWIGLHRQWMGGPFVWVDDTKPSYVNWYPGQPDNGTGGTENCVQLWLDDAHDGRWNDAPDHTRQRGVVELPDKSNPKPLTRTEKALIGVWYEHGDANLPCWIAGTENMLFAIEHERSTTRIISSSDAVIFAPNWKQHAELVKDKILWSDNKWWSRKPTQY